MLDHIFISYSSVGARDFALRLHDALGSGTPAVPVWLDKRDLRPGRDWDDQIAEAIKTCGGLLFVMTPDSVESQSICKDEWTRALKYKKPIIPILRDREADAPFRLANRQYIDFSGDFDRALAHLRDHLQWLDDSPAGALQTMLDRLVDAQRDLRRAADPTQQARIEDDLAELERQIAEQRRIVAGPPGGGPARRGEHSARAGTRAPTASAPGSATSATPTPSWGRTPGPSSIASGRW